MAKTKNNVPKESETEVILIGKKPLKLYILASEKRIQKGSKKLVLKARGRLITTAVDLAEIIKRNHPNFQVSNISFGTEEVTVDNIQKNVSTIEIELTSQ